MTHLYGQGSRRNGVAWLLFLIGDIGDTAEVAEYAKLLPALFYRCDRDEWRAVWPALVLVNCPRTATWLDYSKTVESDIAGWAMIAREVEAAGMIENAGEVTVA